MVEALISGERDGEKLAELAKGRMRPKIPALAEALTGHFGPHHAVACERILGHLDFLNASIAALTEQIDARTAAFEQVYALLLPVPGVDRLTVDVIIAETGADMARFPTAGDLASWVGVCPGSYESAGKRRRVGTTGGNQWLRRALLESGRAAARTKQSYFGAQYRQIARRRGPNKAAVAVAHSLIELVWHLLSTGEMYEDLGEDYFTKRQDPNDEPAVSSPSSKSSASRSPWRPPQPPPPSHLGIPGRSTRPRTETHPYAQIWPTARATSVGISPQKK